ncbi:MAG: class I SAM-dependent methyltransferase [Pseudomonadota bacterium]
MPRARKIPAGQAASDPVCRLCGLLLTSPPRMKVASTENGVLGFLQASGTKADAIRHEVQVYECDACGLVQLSGSPVQYSGLTSVSASSDALLQFRRAQLRQFASEFGLAQRPVVEIGCGDGHGLAILHELGARPFGVDTSAGAIKASHARGFPAQLETVNTGSQLNGAPFSGCVALHVLEHVPDIRTFLCAVRANLTSDAAVLIEVPALEQLIAQKRHIEFFADHLNYFSRNTLSRALELTGFEVLRIEQTWFDEHLTATARVRAGLDWQPLRRARDDLMGSFARLISDVGAQGGRFAIWGASAQAVTLMAELGPDLARQIAFVIDSSPAKQGRRMSGSEVEVVAPTPERLAGVSYVLITATRFEKEIRETLARADSFKGHCAVLRGNEIVPCAQVA